MSILFALGPGPAPRPLEPSYLSPGPSSNALVRLLCQPMPGEPGSLLPPHPILHTPFFSSSQASRWGCVLGSYENMYRLKGQAGTELAPPRDVSAQGLLPVLPGSIQENNSEQEINPKRKFPVLIGCWAVRAEAGVSDRVSPGDQRDKGPAEPWKARGIMGGGAASISLLWVFSLVAHSPPWLGIHSSEGNLQQG